MTLEYIERLSDSPWVEKVTHGFTLAAGAPTRPAELNWHMVLACHHGQQRWFVVGPWTYAGKVHYPKDAEIVWIKFKLGVYLAHWPTHNIVNQETPLAHAVGQKFWLHKTAWSVPTYDNADTFVTRLAHAGNLAYDPVVGAVLNGEPTPLAERTVRQRFLHATGLTQGQIRQIQRAQQAAAHLAAGGSILDAVFDFGYYDQPHLTRAFQRFIGSTPAKWVQQFAPA